VFAGHLIANPKRWTEELHVAFKNRHSISETLTLSDVRVELGLG